MRPSHALALSLLPAALTACETDSPTGRGGPPPAVVAVVGFYQLSTVDGEDTPVEIASPGALCAEREPFRNTAGPRLDGTMVAAFFDGTLDLGTTPQNGGRYALSLSMRTRCTFGDGLHQELEDQVTEEGGFVVDDDAAPTFLLRAPLSASEGYTHLELEEYSLGVDGSDLLLRSRINGVDVILRFRRSL